MDAIYFEEIEVGKTTVISTSFEVTKDEIIEFARRWDPRPFHIDEAAAAASVFGGFVACSAHVFSILSWFAARPERRIASLSALGFDEVRLHQAVRPGDKLTCTFTCLGKRESASNPDRGIVRHRGILSNQDGMEVFSVTVATLVAKRAQ